MNPGHTVGKSAQVAFLVGAGRSGTTLLYKLLCLHPQIAYISNFESKWPWFPAGMACRAVAAHPQAKRAAWFRHGGNAYFVNRPWLKKAFPTPHEGEAVYRRCGLPLTPPPDYSPDAPTLHALRRTFESIRQRANASIFLSKRTANNRRIRQLEQVFPAARYIHLVRDGREVAQSLATVDWWDEHTVWWDGRTAGEIERAGADRLALCARNWVYEMRELERQLEAIEPERQCTLRFESLLQDPLEQLERVTRFLGLPYSTGYRATIESLGLRPVQPQWRQAWTSDQLDTVLREARPTLRLHGYAA